MKINNFKLLFITLLVFSVYVSLISALTTSSNMSFGLVRRVPKKTDGARKQTIEKPKKYLEHNEAKESSIHYEGWIKYLHYGDGANDKAKAFFKNPKFDTQQKVAQKDHKTKEKKDVEFKIPTELYFYSIVYEDSMNILNSKQNGLSGVIDTLHIDYIEPIPDSNIKTGGVVDFGKFNEGYCIKINTRIPTKNFTPSAQQIQPNAGEYTTSKWIVCTDSQQEKDKLYKLIIKLKIKRQHGQNIYLDSKTTEKKSKPEENTFSSVITNEKIKVGKIYEGGVNSDDCYMVILKDWSPCNLACGGGQSFLQLMKVDAKKGGNDCKTKETVLKRDCNTQACPTVNQMVNVKNELSKLEDVREKGSMLVKSVAISKRPQRFDKCHLKESDALMEKRGGNTSASKDESPLVPVRLVMNEKTITAYQDDNLSHKILTFLLDEAIFSRTSDVRRCFIIKNASVSSKFCMIDAAKGDFLEEWVNDFNLFKNQCRKNKDSFTILNAEKKRLEHDYKQKMEKIKLELVQDKADVVKKTFELEEKKNLEKKINQFRRMSFSALEKELRLEDLLEKEEETREQTESSLLKEQIAQEKKKEESLIKAIQEKQLQNQFDMAKVQAQKSIQEIKKNTQSQILKQRQMVAKKIIEMRQKRKRKNAELKNQILSIRSNIADRLKTINKTGDKSQCLDSKHMEGYCKKNFENNYIKLNDCKTKESYCYVCCEHEFGELHVVDRDQCYSECDKNLN